jgi:hypothetical protein
MHKNATKCNKTQRKWCINKHGASKIIDTFETYQATTIGSADRAPGDIIKQKQAATRRMKEGKST